MCVCMCKYMGLVKKKYFLYFVLEFNFLIISFVTRDFTHRSESFRSFCTKKEKINILKIDNKKKLN